VSTGPNVRRRNFQVGGWHRSQNELIDQFARRVGVHAIAVYNVLARFSRDDKVSGVSAETIAETLDCSRSQVFRALSVLVAERMIMRQSVSGSTSDYTLLDLKLKNPSPVSGSDRHDTDEPVSVIAGWWLR
jgi:hypothetical protein